MARTWIMDGHNIIFAIPDLQRLQVSGDGGEARRALVEVLRRFAQARRQKIMLVFDGGESQGSRDAVDEPLLEVAYAERGRGGADDRILRTARSLAQRGESVTVVTNDVSTLAARLPGSVEHLRVRPFWDRYVENPDREEGKGVVGDFSDVERALESLAPLVEPGPATARAATIKAPSTGDPRGEILRARKEKGRARHQRQLARWKRARTSRR